MVVSYKKYYVADLLNLTKLVYAITSQFFRMRELACFLWLKITYLFGTIHILSDCFYGMI